MNAGESESSGRGQFIREAKSGKLVAVRLFMPTSTTIEAGKEIRPLPELGMIATNFEWFNGRVILSFDLKKPRKVHGITATVRAEVWMTLDGIRKRLAEEWYAAQTPRGHESFADFVNDHLNAEQKERLANLPKIPASEISTKAVNRGEEERQVNHRKNAQEVALELLKREYPNFFNAHENGLPAEEQRKAYVADLRAIYGHFPEVEDCASLWSDTGFNKWLDRAVTAPGHKVSSEEWALATGWIPLGYYRMNDAELANALNARTKKNLEGSSWRRKAKRMGLVNARKPGRPENPNELPPSR